MPSTSPSPNSPVASTPPALSDSAPLQPSPTPLNPSDNPAENPPATPPQEYSPPFGGMPPPVSSPTPQLASPPPTPPPTSPLPDPPPISPPPPTPSDPQPPPSSPPPPTPSDPQPPPSSPPPPTPSDSPPPPTPSDSPPQPEPPNNAPTPENPPATPSDTPPPPPGPPKSPPPTPPDPPPSPEPPNNSPSPSPPPPESPPPPPHEPQHSTPSPPPPESSPPPPHEPQYSTPSLPMQRPPRPAKTPPPPSPINSPHPPSPNPTENSPPSPGKSPTPPSSTAPRTPSPSSSSPPRASPPPSPSMAPLPSSLLLPPFISPPLPHIVPPENSQTLRGGGGGGGGGIGTGATVAICLVLSLLFLGILGTVVCCIRKQKKKVSECNGGYHLPTSFGPPQSDSGLLKAVPSNVSGSRNGLGNSRSWFTFEELVEATDEFLPENFLGKGGFGSVYKGNLKDGRTVAVKQLKIGGGQGEREFRSEVEIIGRIHHRHLVSLVGYCISEDRRLLVYEYVPNNTLYFHLHGEDRPVMDWATRVKIATGAARGIAYLHEDCHPRIIHRDIKSSNILLDNNFEARVSDFGLAKLAVDANTHISTRVMGTFGYMAPEYASSGKLTEKSDIYSFGVVLLELITGRKPVDASQPLGDEGLVEWGRPLLITVLETEECGGLADPKLEGHYVEAEMFRMIEAAAACVRHSAAKRPKMGQVVRSFDSIATSDLMNGMKLGQSAVIDSAQQSEEIRLFQRMAFGSQAYSSDFFGQVSCSSESNRVSSLTD